SRCLSRSLNIVPIIRPRRSGSGSDGRCNHALDSIPFLSNIVEPCTINRKQGGGVMFYTLRAVAGIVIAVILSGRAAASQGLVTQRYLSIAMTKTIADA